MRSKKTDEERRAVLICIRLRHCATRYITARIPHPPRDARHLPPGGRLGAVRYLENSCFIGVFVLYWAYQHLEVFFRGILCKPSDFVCAGRHLVLVVLAQSIFFLAKALRRSKELGMDQTKIRKTMKTAAIFTIAPAVAIVISVITLSNKLGLPLPWLRLSVVGSMSYETIAANNALSAMGQSLGSKNPLTAQQFVNVLLVMTISIMVGIWLVPAIGKKLQKGMKSLENRDAKWSDLFSNSLFIGMISAFLGFVFCDVSRLWTAENGLVEVIVKEFQADGSKIDVTKTYTATSGLVPVCTMAVSAVVMIICGLLMKKPKLKWLSEYALPISLIAGMAAAIPLTAWLGMEVK